VIRRFVTIAAVAAAAPAAAQDAGPRFCPNQPSLESSACTTEPGRLQLEVTGPDWTLDRDADERDDLLTLGGFQARLGVGPSTEVQLSWVPWGRDRTLDRRTGLLDRSAGVGDVRLAVRQNLHNPDGKGLSFGLEPFVTLPTGGRALGDGDWGAGLVLPVTYDVTDGVTLGVTVEGDAAADEDRRGRHIAGNIVSGVSVDLSSALSVTAEAEYLADRDPAGHEHQWLLASGVQWRVAPTRALFAEAIRGASGDAPDWRLYAGVAALF